MTTTTSMRLLLILFTATIISCSEQESAPTSVQTAENTVTRDTPKGLDYEF